VWDALQLRDSPTETKASDERATVLRQASAAKIRVGSQASGDPGQCLLPVEWSGALQALCP